VRRYTREYCDSQEGQKPAHAVRFLPVSRPGHPAFVELGGIALLTLVYALWRG